MNKFTGVWYYAAAFISGAIIGSYVDGREGAVLALVCVGAGIGAMHQARKEK